MTLISQRTGAQSLHALVVGIGDYPWLLGGTQPLSPLNAGMGQLTSAPESARAIANWFLNDLFNPKFSGRSLELLLSEPNPTPFAGVAVDRANLANLQAAVGQWVQRAGADDVLLFYFCGHGVGTGLVTLLLPEDFGSLAQPDQTFVDFNAFYASLDQFPCRQQCFLIDACRVAAPSTLSTALPFDLVTPSTTVRKPARSAPAWYATVPGFAAWGRKKKPSFFTSALLSALKGAGSDDTGSGWIVSTDTLHRGLQFYLQRLIASRETQWALADGITRPFSLHHLTADPIVPVDITCDPDRHNGQGSLTVTGVTPSSNVPPGPWLLELGPGRHTFQVAVPGLASAPLPIDNDVRPPFRIIEVSVP